MIDIQDAKGLGYAISTPDELSFLRDVAFRTGIVLDPVYSAKALKAFVDKMKHSPDLFKPPASGGNLNILFVHTGGVFGLYDKVRELAPLVGNSNVLPLLS